jgi:uncharacterized protein involved in outer membrane biogenesis
MSIWKSPIFYFGVILVAIIATALAAPFILDWNAYRDNLESYGRKLTGRDVAISGGIAVRLFPWPKLVLNDVSVANPRGTSSVPMLNASAVTMQLNLAGLFSGNLNIESIDIEHPTLNLTRQKDGSFNYVFVPDQSIRESKLMEHVKFEQINVHNGELYFRDDVHGFQFDFEEINTSLSALDIVGPWRLHGSAKHGTMPLDVNFTSSEYKVGEAFKFLLHLEPLDGSLPALVLDSALKDGMLKGKARLEPVVTADGRQSLEGSFKPLKLQSEFEANYDHIALEKIQITPADTKDSGTLIEGSASAIFDGGVKAIVKLNSPRLDLDSLAGSQSLRVWRAGGVMALLNDVMKNFPEKLDLTAGLDVDALSAAGQTLENLRLKASAEQNAIRINDFTANLPGRSRMKFGGIVFPGEVSADLGGDLAFESNDTRQFVTWLWPEGKEQIAKIWTGSRGRSKAQTKVDWSGKRFAFQNLDYELDGEAGKAELSVQLGNLAAVDLKLDAKSLDLDNFMSGGLGGLVRDTSVLPFLQSDAGFEKRLTLNAGSIRSNGVEAQNVTIDFNSSVSGFEVKHFDIGSVEGASLKGKGLILQGPDGPSGEVSSNLTAANPRGFLRLIGAFPKGLDPSWAKDLGQTDMKAVLTVKPGIQEPLLNYDLAGQSGPLQFSLNGAAKDLSKGGDASLEVAGEISAGQSAPLAQLFGFTVLEPVGVPGKIEVTARGNAETGFQSVLSAELFHAKLVFDGLYKASSGFPELNGKLNVQADDGSEILRAMGVPLFAIQSEPVSINTIIAPKDGGLFLSVMTGKIANQNIFGQGEISKAGKISADLTLDELELRNILTTGFMAWQGRAAGLDESFATQKNVTGAEVWLHPTRLKTGFGQDLKEAVLGISVGAEGRQVTLAARDANGEQVGLDISVVPKKEIFTVSGKVHFPLELERLLKSRDGASIGTGEAIIDGDFSGEGRSPAAVLATVSAKAIYDLKHVKLSGVSPQNFFPKLAGLQSAAELQKALDELLQGPGMELTATTQPISVQDGVVRFAPLTNETAGAIMITAPTYNIANNDFELLVDMQGNSIKDLPTLRVSYAGLPDSLVKRSDATQLVSKLGFAFMARDLAELERVQKEQEKMVADEAAQQKLDEEKFAAFQAQRNELRLRQREQKVFAAQRIADAERFKIELARALKDGAASKAAEMEKLLRLVAP